MKGENLVITTVKTDIGSVFRGKAGAPDAFLSTRLPDRLAEIGYTVSTTDAFGGAGSMSWRAAPINENGVRNEKENIDVCKAVKKHIDLEFNPDPWKPRETPFQLVLGGECCMLPAILSSFWKYYGRYGQKVGLLYIDGDCDLTIPGEAGSSGNFASMTMTHLTLRKGHLESARIFTRPDGTGVIDSTNVVLFGLNITTEGAKPEHLAYLFNEGFRVITSSAVASDPIGRMKQALDWLDGQGVDKILVHLDVDAIDAGDFPLANVPNYTGTTFDQVMKALNQCLTCEKVAGLVVAEVNPDHDPGSLMILRLVENILGALKNRARIIWKSAR